MPLTTTKDKLPNEIKTRTIIKAICHRDLLYDHLRHVFKINFDLPLISLQRNRRLPSVWFLKGFGTEKYTVAIFVGGYFKWQT